MPLSKFESMLKTDNVYFFDATEFEGIIHHYLEVGRHSLAHKALQLGLTQHPCSISLKLLRVELFVFEGKTTIALELLEELQSLAPNNDEVYIQKSIILSQQKKHKEAISSLQTALEITNDLTDIWSLIGMEYLYLDDYNNARLNFTNCIEVDIEDYASLYNILYCYEMTEQHLDAVNFLINYTDKNPYSEIAWQQLGLQYSTLKNYKKALEAFDYAIVIDEQFIGGYLEKAKTLEILNRHEDAIENYLITLKLGDATGFAYIRIGECYEYINKTETAIQYYEKAVHEDPLLEKGWLLLTDIFIKNKNYKKALSCIKKALHIDDSNPIYWHKCADINLKMNQFKSATKAFYTCINLSQVNIEVYIALTDVLLFLGNLEEALIVLIKAKNIYKEFSEIEYRLCGLFMVLNHYEHSLTHLKNGLAINFEQHKILKEVFPSVYHTIEVREIIEEYRF